MSTDAQKRAKRNYQRKVRSVTMSFYPNNEADAAIYAHIKAQPNANAYLKALVEADMAEDSA